MSSAALTMVLIGALCHALWNITVKRAGGGSAFVCLFGLVSLLAMTPLSIAAWWVQPQIFSPWMWFAAIASGLVHVLYSLVLQQGYKVGSFVVVYPVARGTGPVLTVLAAVVLLSERPNAWGWLGVATVVSGVWLTGFAGRLSGGQLSAQSASQNTAGVLWGILTGFCICIYTVLDGWAIKVLGMQPILFYTVGLLVRTLALAPFALRQPSKLRAQWASQRGAIVLVGILSPTAYLLVLWALQTAPLSYVAPIREISMLVGMFLGAKFLNEVVKPSQFVAAAMMMLGVVVLALA
jgi:drug/metabolite transporter (DMT)-like permease